MEYVPAIFKALFWLLCAAILFVGIIPSLGIGVLIESVIGAIIFEIILLKIISKTPEKQLFPSFVCFNIFSAISYFFTRFFYKASGISESINKQFFSSLFAIIAVYFLLPFARVIKEKLKERINKHFGPLKTCPKCGFLIEEENYCTNCGTKLK